MFLKKLYQHSRPGFLIVTTFFLAYFFINIKWGIVASPINQYGMYSTPLHLSDTLEVYLVKVNDHFIRGSRLSFTDRDIVQLYPANYEKQGRGNFSVYQTMKKYMSMAVRAGLMNEQKFSNAVTDHVFTSWYGLLLERILKERLDSFSLYTQHFTWLADKVQPIGSPVKSGFIVP